MAAKLLAFLYLAIASNSGVRAFSTSAPTAQSQTSTSVPPIKSSEIKDISYGEESRKYRRTVYSHDDWVKHRSPDRFTRNLQSLTSSGVYKSLATEVLTTTGIATFIVAYNALVGGFTDFTGIEHPALFDGTVIGLPLTPFTLASSSLGLLLGKFSKFFNSAQALH